ncbi:amidohydrolase [Microbacterium album]|uniref:Amidohydrolase n=1 Tax=Microbacterium album TaxID=2053191 RepID=A0A917IG91_9MICO|nr:amidohydrolase family protein [Microbacterium album]GGH46908.1 amidohydrolase [Microbacterium album]
MTSRIFTGGRVFTGRGETDFVSAFRVTDGVIDWVGDASGVDGAAAHDLGGRVVVPGLLDMHVHPALMTTTIDAVDCLPPAVTSLPQLIDALRTHEALGSDRDAWIVGNGYDETKYPEGRAPTARDLDAVSTTQPVLVWRCDRHSAVCNSRALEIAGITATTPDPPGARFERDADGAPTGVLTEIAAAQAVASHIPEAGPAERAARLRQVGQRLLSRGIVGVCDLLATRIADPLSTYRAAEDGAAMPRAGLFYGWDPADPPADLTDEDRTGRARVSGLKVIMDGAYSNRTAWVCRPYPGSDDDHGLRTLSDEDALAAGEWARRNRVQLAVHAMGDRAIAQVLDLFEHQEPWLEETPSIRIEHATLLAPATIARLRAARMRFGVATHTVFLYAEYDGYERNLRPELRDHAYPIRSLYHELPALALSSDCPATAWGEADNVFVSVEAAVRRRAYNGADIGQGASVSAAQALLLYTDRAASLTDIGRVGRIEVGYEGSFAVLDRDVFTVPSEQIGETAVLETWIAGERVWGG